MITFTNIIINVISTWIIDSLKWTICCQNLSSSQQSSTVFTVADLPYKFCVNRFCQIVNQMWTEVHVFKKLFEINWVLVLLKYFVFQMSITMFNNPSSQLFWVLWKCKFLPGPSRSQGKSHNCYNLLRKRNWITTKQNSYFYHAQQNTVSSIQFATNSIAVYILQESSINVYCNRNLSNHT